MGQVGREKRNEETQMNQRFLVSVGVLIVVGWLAAIPVAAQGPSATAQSYTAPRTPDGQPDLQGFWTNQTYTALERPDDVTKDFYTAEEVATIERGRADREASQTTPGTIPDVHYDFSQFGLDRSQSTLVRTRRTSLVVDPPDGRIPPLTAAGRRRVADRAALLADSTLNELDARCIIKGAGPPLLPQGYNSNFHIVQGPDYVMILVEMIHDARVIPLDGRPQLSESIRQWVGSSRGRWEGETLVVETTNFNGKTAFRGSSETLRVVERFTRVLEDTIVYRFTVDDPATWTRSWTAEVPMKKTIGPLFEFACHEGNYSFSNILSGERAEEQRAEEAAPK